MGEGQLTYPRGMVCNGVGEVVVADRGQRKVFVFDGESCLLLRSWGEAGREAGRFNRLLFLALGRKHLFALDYSGSCRVQLFL